MTVWVIKSEKVFFTGQPILINYGILQIVQRGRSADQTFAHKLPHRRFRSQIGRISKHSFSPSTVSFGDTSLRDIAVVEYANSDEVNAAGRFFKYFVEMSLGKRLATGGCSSLIDLIKYRILN